MIFDSKKRASTKKRHSGLRHRCQFGGHGFDPRTAHITNSTYGMAHCEMSIIKDQNISEQTSLKSIMQEKGRNVQHIF